MVRASRGEKKQPHTTLQGFHIQAKQVWARNLFGDHRKYG